MATHMIDRSTYWVVSGGSNPASDGDYRYYWKIYYDTDEVNRRTKFTIDYYVQTHCTSYTENSLHASVPSGTSRVQINGGSTYQISSPFITINKGANWHVGNYMGSKSFTINHSNDGSASFTFYGSGFGKGTSVSTYSTGAGNFPAIPSESRLGKIDTFDVDSGIETIPITKYVDSYYHTLEVLSGNNVFTTINGFETDETSVVFTEQELNDIYTKIPTGTSAMFTFRLTTYGDSSMSKVIGTNTTTATGNFTIVLPTVNGATCTDLIANASNWTGDTTNQTIIKNQSIVKVSISGSQHATPNTREATIKEYVINGNNIPYNASGVSIELGQMSENYVTIYAVDSRGTSSLPYVQNFTQFIDYNAVTINTSNYEVVRCDSDLTENGVGEYIKAYVEGTWWQGNFGAVENKLTTVVYYANAENGYWEDLDDFINQANVGSLDETKIDLSTPNVFKYNGPVYSSETDRKFDINIPYDILIGFIDEFSNMALTVTVPYGKPAIAVYRNKAALGGPYDETLGGTQLWDDVYLNGQPLGLSGGGSAQRHSITAKISSGLVVTTTANYQRVYVPFDAYVQTGSKLTFDNVNKAIIVGAGVSKVTVSANCSYMWDTKPTGETNLVIEINGVAVAISSLGRTDTYASNNAITPCDVEVSEGDVIKLFIAINTTGKIGCMGNTTHMRVEVLE